MYKMHIFCFVMQSQRGFLVETVYQAKSIIYSRILYHSDIYGFFWLLAVELEHCIKLLHRRHPIQTLPLLFLDPIVYYDLSVCMRGFGVVCHEK